MINTNNVNDLIGASVLDPTDEKIGSVGQVYVSDETQAPVWITVKTGLFGTSESFAPLDDASFDGESVRIPHAKEFVKDAPRISDDGTLSAEEETALYSYYGNGRGRESDTVAGDRDESGVDTTVGYDTSGPTTDDAMTRSEERLHVGTEQVQAGRARLRKHIVTEQVTWTVPVSHDEVTVTREPITEANADNALAGPDLSEEEHEVVLTEERVVVAKETVPVERVALGTETVTEQQEVTEEVAHEEIDFVEPGRTGGDTRSADTRA
jgi:uncharacterized protein (TIGR02271 family)